ncbi:MAG: serine hydrolase domain-containing protein, partial [Reyranellales bacterium]
AVVLLAIAGAARAESPLPMAATPEEVGLSSEQLKRLETTMRENVERGLPPGAAMLVARRGKIAWRMTLGQRDRDANQPMQPDSIFRIYSMTKPIVSVALMQMVEEGRLQITYPVSAILPEIGQMKVGLDGIAPPRAMSVQDLLRHTSGLIYGGRGHSLVHQAYREAKIGDRGVTLAEFVTRLSKLPLAFAPGARWEYGVSTDVLGRYIEVASGDKPLDEVLAERVLKPLGMADTGFWVPHDKVARIAQPWQVPVSSRKMTPRFDPAEKPKFESGGGGLTSTMDDYLRFAVMLANGGTFQGKRILGKKTIEFMTADHVGTRPGRPPGLGFGLGFEVRTKAGEAGLPGSIGEYGWAGNAGTLFWIDPKEQLIAIYMVQVSDPDRIALRNQFRSMVQAAIID